jgi:hypothetical protein
MLKFREEKKPKEFEKINFETSRGFVVVPSLCTIPVRIVWRS